MRQFLACMASGLVLAGATCDGDACTDPVPHADSLLQTVVVTRRNGTNITAAQGPVPVRDGFEVAAVPATDSLEATPIIDTFESPRLDDVDSFFTEASKSILEVSAHADRMRQTIADQQETTRMAFVRQRQTYERHLAALEQECARLEAENQAIQSNVNVLIPANRALAAEITALGKDKDLVRMMLTTLKPKVALAQRFVNQSIQLANAEKMHELEDRQESAAPSLEQLLLVAGSDLLDTTTDNVLLVQAALLQTGGVAHRASAISHHVEVDAGMGSAGTAVQGLSQRLDAISRAQATGEEEMKSHFLKLTSASEKNRTALLQKQKDLNATRALQLKLQSRLEKAERRALDVRGTLRTRTLHFQEFMREVGAGIGEVLQGRVPAASQAMSALQMFAAPAGLLASSATEQAMGNAMDHAISVTSDSMRDFARETAAVQERMWQQENTTKRELANMKSTFEVQLQALVKQNREVQASQGPIRKEVENLQSDIKAIQGQLIKQREGTDAFQVAFTDVWPKMHMAERFIDNVLQATADDAVSGYTESVDQLVDLAAAGGARPQPTAFLHTKGGSIAKRTEEPSVATSAEDLIQGMERRIQDLEHAQNEGEAKLKEQFHDQEEAAKAQRVQLLAVVENMQKSKEKLVRLKASLAEAGQRAASVGADLTRRLTGLQGFTRKVDEVIGTCLHAGRLDANTASAPAEVAAAEAAGSSGATVASHAVPLIASSSAAPRRLESGGTLLLEVES